jgi:uncharacterized protein with ParB-like and HNH nuclease domain
MSYRSETIATTVNRLNVQYFLPAIQREFVWRPSQIVQLFDSIMRGYPISSFLFWELQKQNRDKWEAYTFVNKAIHGGTHNEIANTNGAIQLTLVLDGQQRLTSLLLGLKGTYVVKKKYKRVNNPDAWSKQQLYLDVLKDSTAETAEGDGEYGVHYGFDFHEKAPAPAPESHWIKVGKILDFDSEAKFDDYRDKLLEALPEEATKKQMNVARRNLERLYRAVWKDEVVAYYTETDQDYDRVLDIFVRANEGGTKLSKSDLLLSMVTSKWDGMNAREEIYNFVDRLNSELTRKNDFDKDFIMKSCLVLTDLPVKYKVENFNNANLTLIEKSWKGIKGAIERGVDLSNFFGIDRENLTSANALIPIIYYLFHQPKQTLRGTTPFDKQNASAIRQWLLMTLLNNVFGGSSDTMLQTIREVLQKHGSAGADFPVANINAAIARQGRVSSFDQNNSDRFLALTYQDPESFLALSLLYDENGWGTMTYQKDHIFPQAAFTTKALTGAGVHTQQIEDLQLLQHTLGNLNLMLVTENQGKSDEQFETWLKTRDITFRQKHLIPDDPKLYTIDRFQDFVEARERLIRTRLDSIFPPTKLAKPEKTATAAVEPFQYRDDYDPKVKEGAWKPRVPYDKILWQLLEDGRFTRAQVKAALLAEGKRLGKTWHPGNAEKFIDVAITDMEAAGLHPVVR